MVAAAYPSDATDEVLAQQIVLNLAAANRASLRRLSVAVHAGEVTLRGRVRSFHEKQVAIQACRMLGPIDRLVDAMEVASGA